MNFDINSLIASVLEQNEASASISAAITGNYEQVKTIGEQRAINVVTTGESDAIVAGQKAVGELQAQENARKFATSIGSNMDDSSELMTALGLQHREAMTEAIQAKEVVRQKSSVGLFDDPLAYIMNSITIGDDINYADAAQAKADQIALSLSQINQATQSTVLTQNAIAQTKTAATVEAATDAIRAKAVDQALQIKQQNLIYNVDGLKAANALNEQQLSNLFQTKSAINAEKQLQLAQAQLAESRRMHDLQLKEREEKLKDKKLADQELVELGNTINRGRALLGIAPIPAGKAMQMLKVGGDLGNQIRQQYTIGATSESTGANVITDKPGEAAVLIAKTKAPLAPGMKPVRDLLTGILGEVAAGRVKGPSGLPVDLKDEKQVLVAANEEIKKYSRAMASNIKAGDNTNIYAPAGIESIVKTVPAVAQTQLFQKVLAPLVSTGMSEINPNQIISLAVENISKGVIDFNTASADIVKLFSAAVVTNNVIRDYVRVGLPSQNTFNSTITIKNSNTPEMLSFATEENIKANLVNAVDVNKILSKQLKAKELNLFPPGVKQGESAVSYFGRLFN